MKLGEKNLSWINNLFINLSLIVGTIVFVFIVLEIYLVLNGYPGRIYYIDQNTGLLILKPNSKFIWKKECLVNTVKTNNLGFHSTYEYNKEIRKDKFLIIVTGDSYVECLQVPYEKCFFHQLEIMLNQKFGSKKKFIVFPLGISSNGRLMNYLYYKYYGEKLKPDLVIDLFISNDIRDDIKEFREKDYGSSYKYKPYIKLKNNILDESFIIGWLEQNKKQDYNLLRRLVSYSKSVHFLYHKMRNLIQNIKLSWLSLKLKEGSERETVISFNMVPIELQIFLKGYPEAWKNAWNLEESVIRIYKEEVERNGAKYLLVSGTDGICVHPELKEKSLLKHSDFFDCLTIHTNLSRIAKQNSFNYLGLLPYFIEEVKKEPTLMTVFDCDGHWNEIGHKLAAKYILNYLENHPELIGLKSY